MLDAKRILFVLESLELGGAERQAVLLARHLAQEQGARPEVWGFHSPGRAARLCEENGIPWRLVPFSWDTSRGRRISGLGRFALALRRDRPDIIMPYTMIPNLVCGLLWRYSGARLCVWNQRDEGLGRRSRTIEQMAVRRTPWFLTISRQCLTFLTETLGAPQNRCRLIHNGVALSPARSDRATWRQRLGLSEHDFAACMLANFHINKDHETALRAWRIVLDRTPDQGAQHPVLLLAGRFDGTETRLKALAHDLDLGKSVRFLGPVEDVSGLLSAADIGMLSSRSEACPNAVLESMASGLPVTGSDIPGIREALGDDSGLVLATPGDPETLAERVLSLAADPALRARLAQANRQRAQSEFGPQRMAQETAAFLAEALCGCHRRITSR